jgi:hypothetical protein
MIFKRKKGFATISLGLIYHFMVLPQLLSRDTVPLNHTYSTCPSTYKNENYILDKAKNSPLVLVIYF